MSKITDVGYLTCLRKQRDFLKSEIAEYGKGQSHFALKMASTLRTIFHKTAASKPLLPDLAERYGIKLSFKGNPDGQVDEFVALYVEFEIGNWPPDFTGNTGMKSSMPKVRFATRGNN
jgi:hypothetical protein